MHLLRVFCMTLFMYVYAPTSVSLVRPPLDWCRPKIFTRNGWTFWYSKGVVRRFSDETLFLGVGHQTGTKGND